MSTFQYTLWRIRMTNEKKILWLLMVYPDISDWDGQKGATYPSHPPTSVTVFLINQNSSCMSVDISSISEAGKQKAIDWADCMSGSQAHWFLLSLSTTNDSHSDHAVKATIFNAQPSLIITHNKMKTQYLTLILSLFTHPCCAKPCGTQSKIFWKMFLFLFVKRSKKKTLGFNIVLDSPDIQCIYSTHCFLLWRLDMVLLMVPPLSKSMVKIWGWPIKF